MFIVQTLELTNRAALAACLEITLAESDYPALCLIFWYRYMFLSCAVGKRAQVLSGHKDWISCCSVSPDCSMIASVGRFDRVSLLSRISVTPEGQYLHSSSLIKILPSCQSAKNSPHRVQAVNVCLHVPVWEPPVLIKPPLRQMVCLWSLRSYTFIRNLTGGTRKTLYLLSSCDFSPDGALLATAAFSGSSWWIDLWDPYTAEKLTTLM